MRKIAPEAYTKHSMQSTPALSDASADLGGRAAGTGTRTRARRLLYHLRQHWQGPWSWTRSNFGMNIYSVTQSRCHDSLTDKKFAPARACGGRYARFCQASWESVRYRHLNTTPDVRSQPAGPRLPGEDGPAGTWTMTQPVHRLGRHTWTELAVLAQGRTGVARQQHRARPQPGLTQTASPSDLSPTRIA